MLKRFQQRQKGASKESEQPKLEDVDNNMENDEELAVRKQMLHDISHVR